MDFTSMTESELIDYCKENNINFLTKAKKVYTTKTLLRNIRNFNMENNVVSEEAIHAIEEPKNINEVVWTLEKDSDVNPNYKQIRDNLCNIVKKCHQLLYSNHSIVGTKAQNDIMKLLTLKILQPQFANKDSALYKKCEQLLKNGDISKEDYDDGMSYCLDLNVLKNISGNGKNPLNEWKSFIGYFLKEVMPSIYDINDNSFNFDDEKTFMDLIKIINGLDIDNEFVDAFSTSYGDIHEAFRVYSGGKGAKELGQFFTPRHLIHALINGCGFNDIIKCHENPTIYDPCMGTGGLLTRAFSNGNILPHNIYGCETEKDTIKFGECSILLTTNEFNSNIEKCDSLCNNPNIFNNKFDIIFTNPPFGTKMKYDELKKKFNEYKQENFKDSLIRFESVYPHNSNNGACLFIQHCMYMLKEKGTCAIVLPDGELFSGKSFSKFRKFMCDNIDIIKIINVEGGAFEHTSIKISVIIFRKGSTKTIEFMEIPKKCNQVKSSACVNINNIRSQNYTFILNNYIKKEREVNAKFEIKKLGDVCDIKYGTRIVKKDITKGQYPCYGGGDISFYIDEYNREGFNILISRFALSDKCVRLLNTKFYLNDSGLTISSKDDSKLLNNYIAYYLFNNQDIIYNIARGTAQKNLDMEKFKELEIPIPSLEAQEKIVKDIEQITTSIDTIKLRIKQLKDEAKLFMKYYRKTELDGLNSDADVKTLDQIFHITKGTLQSSKNIEGEYAFITASDTNKTHNSFTHDCECVMLVGGAEGSLAKAQYFKGKFIASDLLYVLISKTQNEINYKYIWYYLNFNRKKHLADNTICCGTPKKMISKDRCSNIEIPIPSLEVQEKIVNIYKENEEKHKIMFLDKIEEEKKHIELLNDVSKGIFNQ